MTETGTEEVEIVTLAEAKTHLRLDNDTEDNVLKIYIRTARDYIENYIDQPIPGSTDSPATPAPDPIKSAALLIIGGLYENREGWGEKEIKENPAIVSLIFPYRVNLGI